MPNDIYAILGFFQYTSADRVIGIRASADALKDVPLQEMIQPSDVLLPLPEISQFNIELLEAPSVAPALAIQKTVAVDALFVFVIFNELPRYLTR